MIWVSIGILVVLLYLAWLVPSGLNAVIEQGRASTKLLLNIEQQLTAVRITLESIESYEILQTRRLNHQDQKAPKTEGDST